MEKSKKSCPLLADLSTYVPDTIDLINNSVERDYWLSCLDEMARKFINKAFLLNPDNPEATANAEQSYNTFTNLIGELQSDPTKLDELSIRTLLEFNEQTLRDNNFTDAWYLQKQRETCAALKDLNARIEFIDNITDYNLRWLEVSRGVLAGNMFDWGARAVTDILEISTDFGLYEAMNTIEKRPWFIDDLDKWISSIKAKPYRNIVIFVDNAGVDFVLGILPFAREFLKEGGRVILTANSSPALNDITCDEMKDCLENVANSCDVIKEALVNKQLLTVENGQYGPCLDLRNIDSGLCDIMESTDLIVLEGMGRAVHTNLNAKFKVDSLKLAVLKNAWLAKSLGGQQFSVIFKYEPISES